MQKKTISIQMILFGFLMFLGMGLRIYVFTQHEFSFDERFSYFFATRFSYAGHFIHPPDNRPPLYYSLIKTLTFLSSDPYILRLPSLLFSCLTLLVIYKTFSKLNPAVGKISTILAAFHPVLINISWQARDYSLLAFLSALTLYYCFESINRIRQNQLPSVAQQIILFCSSLLGLLTSYLYYPFVLALFFTIVFVLLIAKKQILWEKKYSEKLVPFSIGALLLLLIGGYYSFSNFQTVVSTSTLTHDVRWKTIEHGLFELVSVSGFEASELLFYAKLMFVALCGLLILNQVFHRRKNLFQTNLPVVMGTGITCVVMYLLITLFSPVSISTSKGFSAIAPLFVGIVAYLLLIPLQVKKSKVMRLVQALVISAFLCNQFIYLLWAYFPNSRPQNFIDMNYPSITTSIITDLLSQVESVDNSTQIVTLPNYDEIIFLYEWRYDDITQLDLQKQLFDVINAEPVIPLTQSDIHSVVEIYFENNNQPKQPFILLVNRFVKNKLEDQQDLFSKRFFLVYTSLMHYCKQQTSNQKLIGSYEVFVCTVQSTS